MDKKKFTLFWLNGKSEIIEGYSIVEAINHAGYGNVAIRALDFWSEGDIRNEYRFIDKNWSKILK